MSESSDFNFEQKPAGEPEAVEIVDVLDPRWEWTEVRRLCDPEPLWIRCRCRHLEVVAVESVVDPSLVVAYLCRTCDTQLPSGWSP